MRYANLILIVAFLFGFGTCPPGKVCLQPPTVIPVTLDEAYRLIDEGAGNWVFEGECTLTPRITWAQVKQIAEANGDGDASSITIDTPVLDKIGLKLSKVGTLSISEQELFAVTAQTVMRGTAYGERVFCKPDGDKVALQGKTASDLLDALKGYVR